MKSRYVTVCPLRKKSDVASAIIRFYNKIKNASGKTNKVLRANNGGDFRNAAMNKVAW